MLRSNTVPRHRRVKLFLLLITERGFANLRSNGSNVASMYNDIVDILVDDFILNALRGD